MSNYNLGTIGSTPVVKNNFSLSESAPNDIFQFRINSTSNVNLSLTDISAGDDADIILYRDNGNGVFDAGDLLSSQVVGLANASGNRDDAINRRLDAGTYFAEVRRFGLRSSGSVSYDFAVSATASNSTAGFSNLLPKEFELGNLSGDVTRSNNVSNVDTSDTYSFSLGLFEGVNITLSNLLADADIRLIRDSNNNRIVDAGEEVARSTRGGTTSELISNIRQSGDYFLQVNQFSGQTGYALTFDHFTTPEA
ncbi:PPC domain-containing protein [Nostoc sp. FACHB-280]|uniref:PPC domain-containing protein n=1 Tax=Nostoc sp. FACHB-280 TaxID=2692839 RepID=UPI00168B02CD|nr:PPC domain-containing protein [Nostoc sp. FACHB-280]MBD2497910.1 PPC domain-containing protein [Nostoc sp. FACHB-280]